jgi:adenylate cyclase
MDERRLGNLEEESVADRRLSAIMFTDISGYTALAQADERQALEVLEKHNRILRPFFSKYNGREVKTIGDSFLVEFGSALDATLCAIKIQESLHDYNASSKEQWKINLRIGIHVGDVVHKGDDILGDAVNIASRIQPLAESEGVCLSQQVFDQIHNKIGRPLVQLQGPELKNVSYETNVYSVRMPWQETAATFEQAPNKRDIGMDRLRIAVLPFLNMSRDQSDDYFADGMTEEVIASVSRMQTLSVISRTSVMHYKNNPKRTSEISKDLGAGTVVEGSVRKAGNKVRITVKLIDASKDQNLWVQTWEKDFEDVFTIQREIANKIASSLKVRLLGASRLKTGLASKEAVQAYDLYLKGLHLIEQGHEFVDEIALTYLEAAMKLDPSSALIHNAIARYFFANTTLVVPSNEGWQKVDHFARKALVLDPELSEAHATLAMFDYQHQLNWPEAEIEFREALRLNPNSSDTLMNYGFFLMCPLGLFGEAEPLLRKAEKLDPWSSEAPDSTAWVLFLTGRIEEAESKIIETRKRFNDDRLGTLALMRIYLKTGRLDLAFQETRKLEHRASYSFSLGHAGYLYGALEMKEHANRILQKLLKPPKYFVEGAPLSFAIALTYLGLGNKEQAFRHLNSACDERSYAITAAYQLPEIQQLNGDPRFEEIESKMGVRSYLARRRPNC